MEHSFWLKRWQDADTGFHRTNAHPYLVDYWPELALAEGSRIFVPLCGKSSDMVWLAEQGHHVIGAELSPIAIDDFFAGLSLSPTVKNTPQFVSKSAGPYCLWQGDALALTRHDIGEIAAVYDRAALVALPSNMRNAYADVLADLLPAGAYLFLINLSYDPSEMDGPPFSISDGDIETLFAQNFEITCRIRNSDALIESQNLKERGLTSLTESLYLLKRRG